MNQKIIEGNYYIQEKDYQKIKKKLDKKDDYFSLEELQIFTESQAKFRRNIYEKRGIFMLFDVSIKSE